MAKLPQKPYACWNSIAVARSSLRLDFTSRTTRLLRRNDISTFIHLSV
jgi:hypothetical protein